LQQKTPKNLSNLLTRYSQPPALGLKVEGLRVRDPLVKIA
jgi:hypothetical protein